jgi:hypothetical protein
MTSWQGWTENVIAAALPQGTSQLAEQDIRIGVKHEILTVKEAGKDGTLQHNQ